MQQLQPPSQGAATPAAPPRELGDEPGGGRAGNEGGPSGTSSAQELTALSVAGLLGLARQHGVDCSGCVEKQDLVELLCRRAVPSAAPAAPAAPAPAPAPTPVRGASAAVEAARAAVAAARAAAAAAAAASPFPPQVAAHPGATVPPPASSSSGLNAGTAPRGGKSGAAVGAAGANGCAARASAQRSGINSGGNLPRLGSNRTGRERQRDGATLRVSGERPTSAPMSKGARP